MDALLGFFAIVGLRLVDVSLGTLRIMLLTRGSRWRSGAIGFFESLTWVTAASIVLRDLDDPLRMIAFALGFAAGTVLGVSLERLLAVGTAVVHAVSPGASTATAEALRAAGFRVTVMEGEGRDGQVRLAFTVVPRRRSREVLDIVHRADPGAFVTVEDVRTATLRAATAVRK
jgi:uncharacterized protein YebE (UPF0316 family)